MIFKEYLTYKYQRNKYTYIYTNENSHSLLNIKYINIFMYYKLLGI